MLTAKVFALIAFYLAPPSFSSAVPLFFIVVGSEQECKTAVDDFRVSPLMGDLKKRNPGREIVVSCTPAPGPQPLDPKRQPAQRRGLVV